MGIAVIANGLGGAVTVGANTYELAEWSLGREVNEIDNPCFATPVSADTLTYEQFATSLAKGVVGFNGKQNLTKLPQLVFVPGVAVQVTLQMAAGKFWIVTCVPTTDDVTMNAKDGDEYDCTARIRTVDTVLA